MPLKLFAWALGRYMRCFSGFISFAAWAIVPLWNVVDDGIGRFVCETLYRLMVNSGAEF